MVAMRPRPLKAPKKRRTIKRLPIALLALLLLVAGGFAGFTAAQPAAPLSPSSSKDSLSVTTPGATLPWPSYGSGAVGLVDGTVIATHGKQEPMAMASVTKVITALAVLDKYPLKADQPGPTITFTQKDIDEYNRYISINGSVMPVRVGQKLSQREMLEGVLLPSANNVADSLAIWAFGSVDAYHTYANKWLRDNGMPNTVVGGDASGYLGDSKSTATDLITLGGLAMQNEVVAEIVALKSTTLPDTGTVYNYNSLLGKDGINGVKTGNNDYNGGVFVGSTTTNLNGKTITLITALGGASSLRTVLQDSGALLAAFRATTADTTIVQKDTIIGSYKQFDDSKVQAVVANDLALTVLRGTDVTASITMQSVSPGQRKGDVVGSVTVEATEYYPKTSVPIVLADDVVTPTPQQKITAKLKSLLP